MSLLDADIHAEHYPEMTGRLLRDNYP